MKICKMYILLALPVQCILSIVYFGILMYIDYCHQTFSSPKSTQCIVQCTVTRVKVKVSDTAVKYPQLLKAAQIFYHDGRRWCANHNKWRLKWNYSGHYSAAVRCSKKVSH